MSFKIKNTTELSSGQSRKLNTIQLKAKMCILLKKSDI